VITWSLCRSSGVSTTGGAEGLGMICFQARFGIGRLLSWIIKANPIGQPQDQLPRDL